MSEKSKRRAEMEAAERELFHLQNGGGAEDQLGRGILAENKIGIFVISAFHTDDVPVKREAV